MSNQQDHSAVKMSRRSAVTMLAATVFLPAFAQPAAALSTAYKQAVALAAANDKDIAAFYKAREYQPIWTSNRDRGRRRAFLATVAKIQDHGLPTGRYDAADLKRDFGSIKSAKSRGILEVETTKRFLQYAADIQSGILEPRRIDKDMTLRPPRRDRLKQLEAFAKSSPVAFLRALPPKHPDYVRLMKEKVRMERIIARGGWGAAVSGKKLKLGSKGKNVVALRRRLTAMGYTKLGLSPEFNENLAETVKLLQSDHGLNSDGTVGGLTLSAINVQAPQRLMQVVIALERLRWLNKPLGKRHIMVNEADFRATVFDNGKPTLVTRVVLGKAGRWRTPEFEDEMTHMVVNPSWYVPASIKETEYLPQLKADPYSVSRQGIIITDVNGAVVDPSSINFAEYGVGNFPFDMRQPPGRNNALGTVKFLFPNRHAIYLHDTPSKSLFSRDVRSYSHGCVRVQKYKELAYTLLSKQTSDPKALFHNTLATKIETRIDLKTAVPIYLVYRTAWVTPSGRPNYRADNYRSDKKVFKALRAAGVDLRVARS